jgi:hypothetical protein
MAMMRLASFPAAVDVHDVIASFGRILAHLDANDVHDRHLVVRNALRAEISYQRAGVIETAEQPVEEVLS